MRIYLTGAGGFIGSYIVRALLGAGHTVRCLLRNTSAAALPDDPRVERVAGDVTRPDSFRKTMTGCEAVIHLVGIIDEKPSKGITFGAIHDSGTRNVVEEARGEGIRTFILMSANGADANANSGYQRTKWAAEQHVCKAGFDHWTIFRPSIVFGDPGPNNVEFASRLLKQLIRPFPVLPVFGDGMYRLQPVAVEDVASAFVQALTNPGAAGKIYCVGGPDKIAYRDVLDVIARGAGLAPRPKLPQPLWMIRAVVKAAGGILPISSDQLEMLVGGNVCDNDRFTRDFDVSGRRFTAENLSYLRR